MPDAYYPSLPVCVCICADDFGLSPAVNRAIVHLANMNSVQAVGVMVGAPAFAGGAAELRKTDPAQTDIGLHLDLTEFPLSSRVRRSLPRLLALAYARLLDPDAIRTEIRRQLDVFEERMGIEPAFIDGHQHVHQFPGIREILLEELSARYAKPIWIRATRAGGSRRLLSVSDAKARIIEGLGSRALSRLAKQNGLAQNRSLLGVYDFQGGAERYVTLMQGWLAEAKNGDLVMCHPADQPSAADPIGQARQGEFDLLKSLEFQQLVDSCAVLLKPMSRILFEQESVSINARSHI